MLRFDVCLYGDENGGPLGVPFEEACATLAALPRMFLEPDGSFVWRGVTQEPEVWQVDGNLIDRGDRLACAQLQGSCPQEPLKELLRALGWPQRPLAFQLRRRGVVLEESEFWRLAESDPGAV